MDAGRHPNITLLTYSEVEAVSGYVGNFTVRIRKRARSVDEEKCTGCGACQEKCPTKVVDTAYEAGLGYRKAIYRPFAQAVPSIPVIDRANCLWFTKGRCRLCEKVCPTGAIDYNQQGHHPGSPGGQHHPWPQATTPLMPGASPSLATAAFPKRLSPRWR